MQNVKTIRQIHRRKVLRNINPHLLTEEAPKQQAVSERTYWGSMTANLLYVPTPCLSTFHITWRWLQGGTEISRPRVTCKPFDICHQYGSRLTKKSWSLASGEEWLPWVWAILPTQQDPGRGTWDLAKMLGDGSSAITVPFRICSQGAVPACAQQAQPHLPCLSWGGRMQMTRASHLEATRQTGCWWPFIKWYHHT